MRTFLYLANWVRHCCYKCFCYFLSSGWKWKARLQLLPYTIHMLLLSISFDQYKIDLVHVSTSLPVATPRDGGWSDYGEWSDCPAVCGGGFQRRTRTCTNPTPRHGGEDCVGEAEEFRTCNPYPCNGMDSSKLTSVSPKFPIKLLSTLLGAAKATR